MMFNWGRLRSLNAVVVSTRDGNAIKGALVEVRRDALVLRMAWLGSEDQNHHESWTRVDGDVVIPMQNVSFWQESLDVTILGLPPMR